MRRLSWPPISAGSAKDELVKLTARLIVEEALEGQAADAIGRDHYEQGARPGGSLPKWLQDGRRKTRWNTHSDEDGGLSSHLAIGLVVTCIIIRDLAKDLAQTVPTERCSWSA